MASMPTIAPIAQGQTGKNVFAVQYLLNFRGYTTSTDGIFGAGTASSITMFQASVGLPQSGTATQDTIYWLVANLTVSNGASGFSAKAAQVLLSKFETISVDGFFQQASANITATFQNKMGLTASGYVDEYTWLYLFGYDSYPIPQVYASVCSGVSNLTEAQKASNAAFIKLFLMSQFGFSNNAVCAILGNMEQESGINPGIWQSMNNLTLGYGLLQWDDATKFINWAYNNGVISAPTAAAVNSLALSSPATLVDAQLRRLIYGCVFDNEFCPSNNPHTSVQLTYDQFRQSTLDVATLTLVFHDYYEKSNDDWNKLNQRIAYAQKWYNTI